MENIKTILASLSKLDDVTGLFLTAENKFLYSNLPEVYSQEVQETLQDSLQEIQEVASGENNDNSFQEFVVLFDNGSVVIKRENNINIFVILNTTSPSPLVSVALNALALKLSKIRINLAPETDDLVPLSAFQSLVKVLSEYYGPAAKLLVKKGLKYAGVTEQGLPYKNISKLFSYFRKQIDNQKVLSLVKKHLDKI